MVLYIIQPCQELFMSSGLIYSPFLYSKLLYSKQLSGESAAIIPTIHNTTLPGVFYGNLCIVNSCIMNGGIVGALPYRVLYIIQPCQEYFMATFV